jgi:DDE superfamily endonuclease
VFIVTVDGTHCPVYEPSHPDLVLDRSYFSHKFGSSGVNYEVALSIFESQVVWVSGPHPASIPDITVFRQENGLGSLIQPGKFAIADQGYLGDERIRTRNRRDTADVRLFKERAKSRQETFNARLKNFDCLGTRFKHQLNFHRFVFTAVCVLCQYQLENGSPLFEV